MTLEALLHKLANVPAVPALENNREQSKPLKCRHVPGVPSVPAGTTGHRDVASPAKDGMPCEALPQRPIARYRLTGDQGGGTLVGRTTDTYGDLVADLRQRYADRLVEIEEVCLGQE